jgi:hypothetical protein
MRMRSLLVLLMVLLANAVAGAQEPDVRDPEVQNGEPAAARAREQSSEQAKPHPSTQVVITAPDREWFDPPRLQALVAKLQPLVEKHAELKFLRPPIVRVADDKSWAALVRSEMPDARDQYLAASLTWALYVPERDEVVLSSYLANALLYRVDGKIADRNRFAPPMLAHELVHVLQEQHFALPSRLRADVSEDDKRKLKFLVEGHATLIEERLAVAELDEAKYAEYSRKRHLKARRMAYIRGRDYLHNLDEDGGTEAVHAALRGPLPSWPEFVKVAMRKPKPTKAEDTEWKPGDKSRLPVNAK